MIWEHVAVFTTHFYCEVSINYNRSRLIHSRSEDISKTEHKNRLLTLIEIIEEMNVDLRCKEICKYLSSATWS